MSTASTFEREMLELINEERTSRGLNPLQLETQLNASSEDHSTWMLDTNMFSHTGQDGSSATERMEDAGFDFTGSWRSGENIAWQSERGAPGISDDVEQLHANLMNSPGHRANILNPDFEYIGIGVETGSMQGFDAVMVTQNFAATDAEVMLDSDETVVTPLPPEDPVPEEPDTDVTETEDPETEDPDTDVTETEDPETEDPDTDVTETEDPETEDPDTDVTETEDPDDGCFDVAVFLAEIEAFIEGLQARFDQFAWNDDDMSPSEPEDDFDVVMVDDSEPVDDSPACSDMATDDSGDVFFINIYNFDCMMDAA